MFGVNDLDGDEVIVEISAATTTTITIAIIDVEITLAQALAELKSAKSKADKIVIQEPEQGTTTIPTLTTTNAVTTIIADSTRPKAKWIVFHEQEKASTPTVSLQQPSHVKVHDKGKDKMVEPEHMKKMSKKDLLRLDEELAFKLQAEEEEGLAREKAQQVEEANIAWDDVQAKIKADYQLAQRLQAQEQEELTDKEKARLFIQFLEQRRKHFAAKRVEKKGTDHQQELNKGVSSMKKVNTFVDYITELVEESSKKAETDLVEESSKKAKAEIAHESSLKRAGEELEQESSKKQKLEEDKKSEELKQCLEIVPDDGDDVTIDATPLSTRSLTIVLYKIYKKGKKSYFQIIRADVKARFKKTEPMNYMDNFLLLNLKTMFEHHVEDNVWKNQQGLVNVLNWKLYDSCGVHCYDDSFEEELGEDESTVIGGLEVEYFDIFQTRSKLTYHKYLMCGPIPSLFLRNPIIVEGCPSNLKIPCNIGHVHVEKAYIDLNSPLNVITHMQYNWIMRKQLEPREDPGGTKGIGNFTGRIKGMHIFVRNFTYVLDFMIVKDISSIIDPRLSQVVLMKPFVEVSNMNHDLSLGVVKFTDGTNEISYKMPHKIEQYNSLSDSEKEHMKSVYLRNEEDKR
ncbi:hypothetical protein Tco_0541421 [Tanacetum coccineum]